MSTSSLFKFFTSRSGTFGRTKKKHIEAPTPPKADLPRTTDHPPIAEPSPAQIYDSQTLQSLGAEITASISQITSHLTAHSLPHPTFASTSSPVLPRHPSLFPASKTLQEALVALRALSQFDAFEYVREVAWGCMQTVALSVAVHFGVAAVLPEDGGEMGIREVCERCGCGDVEKMTIALRVLCSLYIFRETRENYFANTHFSLALLDKKQTDLLKIFYSHVALNGNAYLEAMLRWPGSTRQTETAFNIAVDTPLPYFEYLKQHPEMLTCFANGMEGATRSAVEYLKTAYPWAELGARTLVDVAGARGHVSQAIASVAPELRVVLQDMGPVVREAVDAVPEELRDRYICEEYDFWKPQRRRGDVYFFRMILHDYSDEDCLRILRNQVHMLRPGKGGVGGRIMIAESITKPGYHRPGSELSVNNSSLCMSMLLNAKERTFSEYEKLFKEVDSRFVLKQWAQGGPQATDIIDAWLEE